MDFQKTSARRILLGSLVGTTIEFFDFYIYANAAVLVFPALFFPSENPTSAMLQSFATFAVAFLRDQLVQQCLDILVIGWDVKQP